MESLELKGQAKVIAEVRRKVDAWRGFALGGASEPYPDVMPRYEPTDDAEHPITDTTRQLLRHWFRREPHTVPGRHGPTLFKYWPHQRRLVETFIYLYEVRRIRRTEQLYKLAGLEPLGPQRDPWTKLGGQLATGSGKTKMMSLLIAWAYLNAELEPDSSLGLGRHALLIAPGLFVKDRLLQDFLPPGHRPSVFLSDPVVPPGLERYWNLQVYDPETCPQRLDPNQGALVVTNYHQLLRSREENQALLFKRSREEEQLALLFKMGEPERLEAITTPLIERFSRSMGLLVLNDEAHHVWDEPGHTQFEQKAKAKVKTSGEDAVTAMAWIRSLRHLNGAELGSGRLALQIDMSATLFEEAGSVVRAGKAKFRPSDLFRHTSVTYDLTEAIRDGIVKRPILERVVVRNKDTGEPEELIREGQPNAWEKYRNLLMTGIERWKKVHDQLRDEGDARKPILFILCNDRNEAREVANYLTFGEASREDLSGGRSPTGCPDPDTGARLFLEPGSDGTSRSTVIEIHIGQKEESNETEWDRIRQSVNAVDSDEIPDPSGAVDDEGIPLMQPNPYNVVVSVMMLKEGWDVRNVKVIVPLRPCDSRTLTEQTLGRGLRKMHAPLIQDDGAVSFQPEQLFVIQHPSFEAIIDQISDLVEQKDSSEIEHGRDYAPILQKADPLEREKSDVRIVRFEGLIQTRPDWRKGFEVNRVPALSPRVPWKESFSDTEIQTWLKSALSEAAEEGLHFTLTARPSWRDFDHVMEQAYAIPLLRELRASFHHKNAVKGVVQQYLERRVFQVPMGMPLSFAHMFEDEHALIALGNLARPEVIDGVRRALLRALHAALTSELPTEEALLSERRSAELSSYQALRKHVLEAPVRTTFERTAFDNNDELRVGRLLDRAVDVVGWVYNHQQGVGFNIEYDWQGYTPKYYPDFIVRAKIGPVFHNMILEVKGRLEDRDKEKARRGRRYSELLTDYDREPWHYLMLLDNSQAKRNDITWWEAQSVQEMGHLLRRHEGLPLIPDEGGSAAPAVPRLRLVSSVRDEERFRPAIPVLDLAVAAGAFSEAQEPEPIGWAYVATHRAIDKRMFVAKVVGRSMEPGIAAGSWGLFRSFPVGASPVGASYDGRRVLVQLRDASDPETGGRYTLKRWRVGKVDLEGRLLEVTLVPDNHAFPVLHLDASDGGVRVVAEYLEGVGPEEM